MKVNGWALFQHPLFKSQFDKLLTKAEKIKARQPNSYRSHKTVKLLAKVENLILSEIPEDPGNKDYNQGNTLGTDFRHWKRAKFGRYRLFFRYLIRRKSDGTEEKLIIYVWLNDDDTLRKEGDKNDPYALFVKGLYRGQPPDSFDALLKESLEIPDAENEGFESAEKFT